MQPANQPMPAPQQPAAPQPAQQQAGQMPAWFNQEVQNTLFARIQALSPEEIDIMETILTDKTFPVLAKVFPELFTEAPQAGGGQAPTPAPSNNPMPKVSQPQQGNPLTEDTQQPNGLARR